MHCAAPVGASVTTPGDPYAAVVAVCAGHGASGMVLPGVGSEGYRVPETNFSEEYLSSYQPLSWFSSFVKSNVSPGNTVSGTPQ